VAALVGDLATDNDAQRLVRAQVRIGMQVLKVSAKTGQGMDDWLHFLDSRLSESRQHGVATASR
jgi:hypothetical protein